LNLTSYFAKHQNYDHQVDDGDLKTIERLNTMYIFM